MRMRSSALTVFLVEGDQKTAPVGRDFGDAAAFFTAQFVRPIINELVLFEGSMFEGDLSVCRFFHKR
jgi:hypothetical protein